MDEYMKRILKRNEWTIVDGTYEVLDPYLEICIAKVTSTNPSDQFTVLVEGSAYTTIDKSTLVKLGEWIEKNK